MGPISIWPYSHRTPEENGVSENKIKFHRNLLSGFVENFRIVNLTLVLLVLHVLFSLNVVLAGPVLLSPEYTRGPVTLARNIRHLPCISRRTGDEGVCMFAIDCLKANGSHLGTCIDRFYFGSCCQIPDKTVLPTIIGNNIEDNSIDSANFVHPNTEDRVEPTVTTVASIEAKTDGSTSNKVEENRVTASIEKVSKPVPITEVPIKLSTFQTVSGIGLVTEPEKPVEISTESQTTQKVTRKPLRPTKPTYKPRPGYKPSNFSRPSYSTPPPRPGNFTTKPKPTKPVNVLNSTRKPIYRPPPKRPTSTKKPLPIPPRLNITILPQSTSSRPIFTRPQAVITYINTTTDEKVDKTTTTVVPLTTTPEKIDVETTVSLETVRTTTEKVTAVPEEKSTRKPEVTEAESTRRPEVTELPPGLVTWSSNVVETKAPENDKTTVTEEIWSPITPPEGWILISTVPPKPESSSSTPSPTVDESPSTLQESSSTDQPQATTTERQIVTEKSEVTELQTEIPTYTTTTEKNIKQDTTTAFVEEVKPIAEGPTVENAFKPTIEVPSTELEPPKVDAEMPEPAIETKPEIHEKPEIQEQKTETPVTKPVIEEPVKEQTKPELETQPEVPDPKPEVESQTEIQATKPESDASITETNLEVEQVKPITEIPEIQGIIPEADLPKPELPEKEEQPENEIPSVEENTEVVEMKPGSIEPENTPDSEPQEPTVEKQPETQTEIIDQKPIEEKPEINEPEPVTEQSKPEMEQPQPEIEETKPQIQDPKPDIEEPRPEVQQPKPEIEQPKPVIDEANRPTDEPTVEDWLLSIMNLPNLEIEQPKPNIDTPKPTNDTISNEPTEQTNEPTYIQVSSSQTTEAPEKLTTTEEKYTTAHPTTVGKLTTTEKITTKIPEFTVHVTLTPTVPEGLVTFSSVSSENVTPATISDSVTPLTVADNVTPATVGDSVTPLTVGDNVTSLTAGDVNNVTTESASANVTESSSSSPLNETSSTVPSATAEQFNMTNYKDVCGRRLWPEARIVGGAKSGFGRWPWQISLRQWRTSTYLHKCGAALLNENWAITAAHCVEHVPPGELLVRLGEHDLANEEEPYGFAERRVQIVASHPHFDPATFEYDLALLRFYEPVNFQPNILPVCVPDNDDDYVGKTAHVTGWGRLYDEGPLPSVLQEVEVPVINNTACESMYQAAGYNEHIPNIFICAGWRKGGADSCEGDSGGPMVVQRERDKRFVLGGVISWGIGCAEPNQPGVYTRISEFRDWINQILQF